MRRETRDKILMIILGVVFFLNIIAINLFPTISEELVVVGYTIFGIGAFLYILSVFTLRGKVLVISLTAGFMVLFGIHCI